MFFLLGGPLCLRSLGDTAVAARRPTLAALADQAVFGWKDLLTTLPPVDGDGPLLVLPWLLGLSPGCSGTALAHLPVRRAWLAAAAARARADRRCSSRVILLGVRQPQSLLAPGRRVRRRWPWPGWRCAPGAACARCTAAARCVRLASAPALVLALAAGLAFPAAPWSAGDDDDRAVAAQRVEPPFDIGQYPSPLAGFRKYVDLQGQHRPGQPLRQDAVRRRRRRGRARGSAFAAWTTTTAWSGAPPTTPCPGRPTTPSSGSPPRSTTRRGRARSTPRVTLGEGYSGVWLPTVGALQSLTSRRRARQGRVVPLQPRHLDRRGARGAAARRQLPFTAVAARRRADRRDPARAERRPPLAAGRGLPQARPRVDRGRRSDPMERVLAIAEHLRTEGKYSDGVGPPSASTSPATASAARPTSSSTPRSSSATTSSTPPRWRCSPTRSACRRGS